MKKRTTIYLDPELHQALQAKSAATNRSMSRLINKMVEECLAEDAEDLRVIHERARDSEICREELLAALHWHGEQ
jgi:predicted DNA-binding protein